MEGGFVNIHCQRDVDDDEDELTSTLSPDDLGGCYFYGAATFFSAGN